MTIPATGPTDQAKVLSRLRLTDEADVADVEDIAAAVDLRVRSWPVGDLPEDYAADEWPADIVQGATMLTMRLFRRRNSPLGVESIGDGPAYVRRNDPDIAALLRLGDHLRPQVG